MKFINSKSLQILGLYIDNYIENHEEENKNMTTMNKGNGSISLAYVVNPFLYSHVMDSLTNDAQLSSPDHDMRVNRYTRHDVLSSLNMDNMSKSGISVYEDDHLHLGDSTLSQYHENKTNIVITATEFFKSEAQKKNDISSYFHRLESQLNCRESWDQGDILGEGFCS